MPADRFFLPQPLQSPLFLEGKELHHLAHVMRARIGETLEIVNGQGELATAELVSLDKKKAELKIISHKKASPPQQKLILAQAYTRHLDWIIEKGTELGADEFWLFPGDQSEKKVPQLPRLETLAIQALKQCGRLFLPKIVSKPSLPQFSGSVFYGDPHASPLKGPFSTTIIFIIGPEKGFSPRELDYLAKNGQGVSLHENILRAETAAITALGQLYLLLHP